MSEKKIEWINGYKLTDIENLKKENIPIESVMNTLTRALAHQIFVSGFVHCDPHPGNVLVRKQKNGTPQVVLLDHGLYIEESPQFRSDYCELWKAILLMQIDSMKAISKKWGIKDAELFASSQIMKPYQMNKAVHLEGTSKQDIMKIQMKAKQRVKDLLEDTRLIPRELIFIGRSLNLIRANNKALGSPVNRVKILADAAVQGVSSEWKWTEKLQFKVQIFSINLIYYLSQMWIKLNNIFGRRITPLEEVLEANMYENLGFRLEVDEKST